MIVPRYSRDMSSSPVTHDLRLLPHFHYLHLIFKRIRWFSHHETIQNQNVTTFLLGVSVRQGSPSGLLRASLRSVRKYRTLSPLHIPHAITPTIGVSRVRRNLHSRSKAQPWNAVLRLLPHDSMIQRLDFRCVAESLFRCVA